MKAMLSYATFNYHIPIHYHSWRHHQWKQTETMVALASLAFRCLHTESEIFACRKINKTSRCDDHVYTLPPKLSFVKKNSDQVLGFFCIRSIHFNRNGWGIRKNGRTHARISDSVWRIHQIKITINWKIYILSNSSLLNIKCFLMVWFTQQLWGQYNYLAMETWVRPVYTKHKTYKDNYFSVHTNRK